jgi:chromosome segregation ATPase
MKLTNRERLLLPVMPVAVILAGFAWWFNAYQRPGLDAARSEYDQALAHQVRPPELAMQETSIRRTEQELARLEQQQTDLNRQADAFRGEMDDRVRHVRARELNQMLVRHGLVLIEERPSVGNAPAKLPRSLAEALNKLKKSPVENSHFRTLRLAGRFAEVRAAIRELADSPNPPGVPVSVTMDEARPTTDLHTWTLVLWM